MPQLTKEMTRPRPEGDPYFELDRVEEIFEEMGQGFQSMSPALRSLEEEIINENYVHPNHPALNLCIESAVVTERPRE